MAISTESALSKVRALLDRADHPNTPPAEADSCRVKAEQLMRKYRIDEEDALAKDPQVLQPDLVEIKICESSNEFRSERYWMVAKIAEHNGVKLRYVWRSGYLLAAMVGYPIDLKLTEMMFTAAQMAFSEHLEPTVDPDASDQINAYRMRKAGMERNRIAARLWGSAMDDGKAHGKVQRLYLAECRERDESPAVSGRGVNAKEYRKQYAYGFYRKLSQRLHAIRDGADSIGGRMELSGREERVAEEFYRRFPEERPVAVAEQPAPSKPAKPRKLTKADQARIQRMRAPAVRAALLAGEQAASTVPLDGSQPAQRLDRYTNQEREDTREIWAAIEGR